jgi:hypothetical protein
VPDFAVPFVNNDDRLTLEQHSPVLHSVWADSALGSPLEPDSWEQQPAVIKASAINQKTPSRMLNLR